ELYDLAADPHEATNLVVRAPERQRALAARLTAFHPVLPGAARSEDPNIARRLQSLGYVSGGAARKTHYTDADDPKQLIALDKLLHDGVAFDLDGGTRDAMAVYRQVLARRPDMISAARHLAYDDWRTGNADEAIATLRAALKAGPVVSAAVQLGTYLAEI